MIVFGVVLVVAGAAAYFAGAGELPGVWWLLAPGLIAAGLGVLVAGTVALARRRWLLLRAARRVTGSGEAVGGPVRRVKAIPRMIAASWRGRYAALPRYQTVLWAAAVVYLIWPIDLVPELLPLVGISDDIGVGAWLLTSLYAESGNYLGQAGRTTSGGHEDSGELG
ncbi:YkvA family protein [Parasphingorhabdus pacifica]